MSSRPLGSIVAWHDETKFEPRSVRTGLLSKHALGESKFHTQLFFWLCTVADAAKIKQVGL